MQICCAAIWTLAFALGSGEEKTAGKTALEDLLCWIEPATKKVFPDTPAGPAHRIDLAAARGERESAQVVLRPQESGESEHVFQAQASDLKDPEGAVIPSGAVELRRVAYVPVPYTGKSWPDPLVPIGGPGAWWKADKDQDAVLLATVRVPRNAKPGAYQGTLSVGWERRRGWFKEDREGYQVMAKGTVTVPLALRVFPFEIPDKPSVKTAFGLSMDFALKFEGIAAGTPEARAMNERYWRILVDHRISPYEIPVDILDPDAGRFLDDPRVTSFTIPYRDDLAWVKARVDRAREKGWLDRAYFYPWDEPVTADQYAALKGCVGKIRSLDPKLRIVSPFFRDAESGKTAYNALDGLVTIWCPVSAYFKQDRMEEKRRKGEEVWWYVCCGPGSPFANLHLTMDAADHRVLPWQMYRHRIEGFLYWSTTYWNPAHLKNPWLDMVTVPDINKNLSGDGSLLYPGLLPSGDRVAEGPVASLRLLNLLDGFEDLEYLALLEKKASREAANAAAAKITQDLQHFTKDPAEFEKVRREVAEKISGG